jgi:hypothetical protein
MHRMIAGFAAGALAVLVFHQGTLFLLHLAGVIPRLPWSIAPVPPWGVPAIVNAMFWGGLWGIAFAALATRFPRGPGYWVAAFLFGAVFLNLVGWLVVPLFKHRPAGFPPLDRMWIGLLIHGVWGIGAGVFLRLAERSRMI